MAAFFFLIKDITGCFKVHCNFLLKNLSLLWCGLVDVFKFKTGGGNLNSPDGLKIIQQVKLLNVVHSLLPQCNYTHHTRSLTPTTLHKMYKKKMLKLETLSGI